MRVRQGVGAKLKAQASQGKIRRSNIRFQGCLGVKSHYFSASRPELIWRKISKFFIHHAVPKYFRAKIYEL